MQRGRRAIPAEEKRARGTYQPSRDADKLQLTLAAENTGPILPDMVKENEGALKVWEQLHHIVTAFGANEGDSNIFARYCMMEALARDTLSGGEMISAGAMNSLRQYEELLRIAGPKSRLTSRSAVADSNPFSRNGKKRG